MRSMLAMAKLRLPMNAWEADRLGKGPPLAAHAASSHPLAAHWFTAARAGAGGWREGGRGMLGGSTTNL